MLEISIDPTREQIKALATLPHLGTIVMINLLKFKETMEGESLSGKELYQEYAKQAAPFIQKSNGKVLWKGQFLGQVISPKEDVEWDEMLLVEYPTKEHFLEMIKSPEYPSQIRTKSIEDSRLWVTYTEYMVNNSL